MPRLVVILVVVCVIVILAACILAKPLIIAIAKKQLESIFVQSEVSIRSSSFNLARRVILYDIQIKRPGEYGIKIKEAGAEYNLFSIFTAGVAKLFLKDITVAVDSPGKGVKDLPGYLSLSGSGPAVFARVEVSGLNADIRVRSLTARINASFALDVRKRSLGYLDLKLQCEDLGIEGFIRDFKLGDKFNMTGSLSGELNLAAKGSRIEMAGGNFSVADPGGILVITDSKFLENMARSTRQPMDTLVESFKDYKYNTAIVQIGQEKGDIVIKSGFQGDAGRRDLEVVLHDFKLRR